jgi:hypothetical protein
MQEFRFSRLVLCCALILGLSLSFCGIGNALNLDLFLPIDQVDEAYGEAHRALYDMALTNGAAHVVYTKSNNVYYAVATKGYSFRSV